MPAKLQSMVSDSEDSEAPQTPQKTKKAQAQEAPKRKKARIPGVAVLESNAPLAPISVQPGLPANFSRAKKLRVAPAERHRVAQSELRELDVGFADDYFRSQNGGSLRLHLAAKAAEPWQAPGLESAEPVDSSRFPSWKESLDVGFSLLLHGIGSKRPILNQFAKECLEQHSRVVSLYCFHAKFSLSKLFLDVLDRVFPDARRRGNSAEQLGMVIRKAAASGNSHISFVVHNLELLSPAHQRVIASLAAGQNVSLVASVDSIWAPLNWDAVSLRDFNWSYVQAHTFASSEAEWRARCPNGLPAWTGLGEGKRSAPRASLAVVLRSLTPNHRELVQYLAESQLEGSKRGVSRSNLLKIATEHLICDTLSKLNLLLNELRDHEIVLQRSGADGVTYYQLPYDERTLQRLRDDDGLSETASESESENEAELPKPEEQLEPEEAAVTAPEA